MLKTLACPSYVQTQHHTDEGTVVDAVVVPYDQFHTFMIETHRNNMQILEINTILADLVKYQNFDELNKIINRTKKYLADQ